MNLKKDLFDFPKNGKIQLVRMLKPNLFWMLFLRYSVYQEKKLFTSEVQVMEFLFGLNEKYTADLFTVGGRKGRGSNEYG